MTQHVIYGLIDPNTKELRYIGYTSNIKRRYVKHHNIYDLRSITHKNNWIKSLLAKGQKAELLIIESYDTAEELPQAEIEMIAYYKFIGCNLTNTSNGGEGAQGRKHTEATKLKMSLARKGKDNHRTGKKHSEETRRKLSEATSKKGHKIIDGKFVWFDKVVI